MTVTLNPAIDLNLVVPDWPKGDLARATSTSRAAGGKGVNVSRVLSELDVHSTAFCIVGGPDGQVFLSLLMDVPFKVESQAVAGPTRTNITVAIERGGGQFKINQPGPHVTREEWRHIEAGLRASMKGRQWVILSGALPPQAPAGLYARLVRMAHREGARVVLDCAGPSLAQALAARPDLIKPNREELGATIGQPCRSRKAACEAARELQRRGAGLVIVSHGKGVCLALGHDAGWQANPPRVKTQSLMGGGDSLVAGLVAGFIRGLDLPEALRLGVACGAASAAAPETLMARRTQIRRLAPQVQITGLIRF